MEAEYKHNEEKHQYWYHGDHLGSAQLITNYQGLLHERIEYAPYGELWIEHRYEADSFALPYLFTGKELDPETNLYYYGARYLDPKRSRWISTDPAMGEYIPGAPVNDEARKRNQDLPGIGGVFNIVNLHVYHYAGNNPVKYVDPDGRKPLPVLMLRTPTIEVQRGQSNNSFNDTLKIFDETGKKVYSGKVHSEMSLPQTNSSDFTLPAGEYKATLSKTATLYENSLRISSDTVISPETGTKGISSSTGHLIHPNEITRETARTQRTNQGRSNGPFQTPQSLGCILFRNKENFNEMWSVLEDLGFKDGSSFRLIIKDPLFIE